MCRYVAMCLKKKNYVPLCGYVFQKKKNYVPLCVYVFQKKKNYVFYPIMC